MRITCLAQLPTKRRIVYIGKRLLGMKSMPSFTDERTISYLHRKKAGLFKNREKVRTVVLGSSHADYGYFPDASTASYNLGLVSLDLHGCYHLYRQFVRDFRKIENVIVFVSVFSPGFTLIRTKEKHRCIGHRIMFGIPYLYPDEISTELQKAALEKFQTLRPLEIPEDYFGYEITDFFHATAESRATTHVRESLRGKEQVVYLASLLREVEESGKQAYVVSAPARSDYKKFVGEKIGNPFDWMDDVTLCGAKFVDFYSSKVFDDHDMGDPDHMNKYGAMKMRDELEKIMNGVSII